MYYISSQVNAGGGGTHKLFLNGGLEQSVNLPVAGQNGLTPNQSGTQKVGIGTAVTTAAVLNGGFNGIIDEVRISNVARSTEWLAFQNRSMRDTVATFGAIQNVLGIGALTSTTITPADTTVSASGNVVVAFTSENTIPADGKIVVTFPTSLGYGFNFNSGGSTSVTSSSGLDGTFSVSISGNIVTITRVGGTSSTAGAKSLTLSYIQNPLVAGSTGTYSVRTYTAADAVVDENVAVGATTIVAGSLTSTNVEPQNSLHSTVGSTTITFTSAHAIPSDGKIVVTFPTSLGSGFTFNSGGTTVASSHTMGGSLAVSIVSNVVTVTRSGGATTTAGETESITLSRVQNPTSSGSTGVYQIKTTNASSATIDQDTSVTADTITSSASSWWNNSWANRIKITFNNTAQPANLVNFPVRVALNTSRVTYGSFKANGDDIRFVDANNTTELDYEIENWVTASTSNIWVEVPQIDASSATDFIYMYYNNPAAAAAATTTGVWDSNYVTVHHFGQTSGTYFDSTRYDHDSDVITSVTRSETTTGTIGYAAQFSGGNSTSYITIPDSNDYDMTSYTIETYIQKIGNGTAITTGTGGQSSIYPIIAKGMADAENVPADVHFFLGVTAGNVLGVDFENFDVDGVGGVAYSQNAPVTGTSTISNNTWYYAAQRFDNANDSHRVQTNLFRGASTTSYVPNTGGTQKVGIGTATKAAGLVSAGGGFNGLVDEVRISNVARAEEWLSASYLSTSDGYNTYAAEESTGGGALTSTNVEPASLVAGVSGNVVISFTTATALPANGKIIITLPTSLGSGFTLNSGGSTAVTSSSGFDGTFSVSVSGNVVTVTRANDGSSSGVGAKSITLSYIKNPNLTGSTGTYQIRTTNSSETTIDLDTAVSADIITSSSLSTTNVEPASLTTSSSTNVTVSFTTANTLPANGKIVVTFPTSLGSGFSFNSPAVSTASGIDGSFSISTNSNVMTITRTGTGNAASAGAKTLVVSGITTPNVGGSTGTYQIKTTDSISTTIDEDTAVSADNIVGTLTSVNVEPASLVAGTEGNVVVTFTTATALPSTGKIVVNFPITLDSGFVFDSGGTTAVSSASGIDGSFAVSASSGTLTLVRSGGSSSTAGAKSITLSHIKNPTIPGSTGTYEVYTKTSADVTLEQKTSVTADTITPGSLSATNVQPASLVAGATGNITVTFTTANPIAPDGRIYVYLPISLGNGFIVDSGGVTDASALTGIDGTVSVTDTNNYITITRNNDGATSTAGVKSFVLSNIKNPDITGSTAEYTIETQTSSAITIDQDLAVSADTITSGGLSSANVQPATLMVAEVGTTTIQFTTSNPIPSDGKIVVTFPTSLGSGFAFNSGGTSHAVSATLNGTLAVSLSSNVLTLTRSGGTASGAGEIETITLGYVKNPTSAGSTGTYSITTKNSSDVTIDTVSSVSADTITESGSEDEETEESTESSSTRSGSVAQNIQTPTPTIPVPVEYQPASVADSVVSIIKDIIGLPTDETVLPPIDEDALRNGIVWAGNFPIVSPDLLDRLLFAPLPNNLVAVFQKFPQLKNVLDKTGIIKGQDAIKLVGVNFSLPRIADIAGNSSPIPIADLTPRMIADIPTNVVFTRTVDEKLDLALSLTVTESGEVRQILQVLEGQDVKLFIKTEGKVAKVTGLVEMYPEAFATADELPMNSLTASAFFANPHLTKAAGKVERRMVVEQFEYTDENSDGIYEAKIKMPVATGQYKVRTIIEDIDPSKLRKEVEIVTVIDPEGYIYESAGNNEVRMNGAEVTLYTKDGTDSFVLWPARDFLQENPQTTDKTGRYAFLVPEGTYRIEVKNTGYLPYVGEEFTVATGKPVHTNIELFKDSWWRRFKLWVFGRN